MQRISDRESATTTEIGSSSVSGTNFTDYNSQRFVASDNNNIISNEGDGITVETYDVLCGRDKNAFNNVGNRRFRVVVAMHLDQYVNVAKTRKEKSSIIRTIIDRTKACGGRFLALRDGQYVVLTERETHDKVGHAVRDMVQARSKGGSDTTQLSNDAADADLYNNANNNRKDQITDTVQSSLLDFVSNARDVPEIGGQSDINATAQTAGNLKEFGSNFGSNTEFLQVVSNAFPQMDDRNAMNNGDARNSLNNVDAGNALNNVDPRMALNSVDSRTAFNNVDPRNAFHTAANTMLQHNSTVDNNYYPAAVDSQTPRWSLDSNNNNANYHQSTVANSAANLPHNNTNIVPDINNQISNMNLIGQIHSNDVIPSQVSATNFNGNASFVQTHTTMNESSTFNNNVNQLTQLNNSGNNINNSFYQAVVGNSNANLPQHVNNHHNNNNNNQNEQQVVQGQQQNKNNNFMLSHDSMLSPQPFPDNFYFAVENVAIQLANPLWGPMIQTTEISSSLNKTGNDVEKVQSNSAACIEENGKYESQNTVLPNRNTSNNSIVPNVSRITNAVLPTDAGTSGNELVIDFSRKLQFDRSILPVTSARPSRRASMESIGTFGDYTIDTISTNEKTDTFVFDELGHFNLHDSGYINNWEFENSDMEYIIDLDHRFTGGNKFQNSANRAMTGYGRRRSMETNNMENYAMQGLNRRSSMENNMQGVTRQTSYGTRRGSMGTIPSLYGKRGSLSTIGTIGEDDISMGTINTNLFLPNVTESSQMMIMTSSSNSIGRRNTMGTMTMTPSHQQLQNSIAANSNNGRRGSMETHSTVGRRASIRTIDLDGIDQFGENLQQTN